MKEFIFSVAIPEALIIMAAMFAFVFLFIYTDVPEKVYAAEVKPIKTGIEVNKNAVEQMESLKDPIRTTVEKVCEDYPDVSPELVMSVIYHESRFNQYAKSKDGSCVGFMQISTRWNKDRAKKLGITDFYDMESNIRLGADILQEFYSKHNDMGLALMMYNMDHKSAYSMWKRGKLTVYAKSVLAKAEDYK